MFMIPYISLHYLLLRLVYDGNNAFEAILRSVVVDKIPDDLLAYQLCSV